MRNPSRPLVCIASLTLASATVAFAQSTSSTAGGAAAAPAAAASQTTAAPQPPRLAIPQPSPESTVRQKVGLTDIEIKYSRPGVKGRDVFAQLAPYGEIWRTGANNATTVSFSTDVEFGGVNVPAGTYALFSIPDRSEWTIILSKNTRQWGSYRYEAKDDAARVKATPVALGEPVETFTIDINDIRDDSATLNLIWHKTRVPVRLKFDTTAKVVAQIEALMSGDAKPSPGQYFQAGLFYLNHDLDLAKAGAWIDQAIAATPNGFYMHYHKARLLAKQGDKAGARAASAKSVEIARAQGGSVAEEYLRLNATLMAELGQ